MPSSRFSLLGIVFLISIWVGGASSFAVATVGLPEVSVFSGPPPAEESIAGELSDHRKLARNFPGDYFLFLKGRLVQLRCLFCHLCLQPAIFSCAMKGVRAVAIESKSFDLRVVGSNEDILKISGEGREILENFA